MILVESIVIDGKLIGAIMMDYNGYFYRPNQLGVLGWLKYMFSDIYYFGSISELKESLLN